MDSESAKDGEGNSAQPADLIELKIFNNSTSAELAKVSLEARGIECWLTADDCGGMLSAMDAAHGVKLFVRRSDNDAAKALIASSPISVVEPTTHEPASSGNHAQKSSPRIKLSLPQLVAGVVAGILLCLLYQWTTRLGTKVYRSDTNGDGKADTVWIYQNGRCVETDVDRNFDGIMDSWTYYDSSDRCTSAKADNNFDGTPDVWWISTNGIPAMVQTDTDFNGKPDVTGFFKDNEIVREDWQPNGTNVVTLRQFFRHGVLVEESRDTNMDGTLDVTIQFDAFENPIRTNESNWPSSLLQ